MNGNISITKRVDILYGKKEKTMAKINSLLKLSHFSLKIEMIRFPNV